MLTAQLMVSLPAKSRSVSVFLYVCDCAKKATQQNWSQRQINIEKHAPFSLVLTLNSLTNEEHILFVKENSVHLIIIIIGTDQVGVYL